VVRASTGQVGKIMVERPHRLPVGGQSIVGYVTGQGEPRIALDVGEDKVHFNNPLLPDTRSELALPLISRGTVIGALDVQSVEANAFNLDDVETLQIMADQLTVALENASLFEKIARTLERTQSLYRVSHALTTASDPQSASETVLGEYLRLLGLNQGSFILLDRTGTISQAQARFVKGQAITPTFKLPVQDDLVFQQLLNNPTPLVIHDTKNHPLLKSSRTTAEPSLAEAMLYIPVTVQGKVVGALVADAVEANHTFSQEDIEVGEVIAGQLSVRLEGWQLLLEAQHNSTLLKTAAEISRAASSILDVDHLIDSSVNLIRNEFDLYYVGLFMVDATKKWAILRAGTGEAGRFQIEAGHRLKIGGGSMIGWSVQHREPRIALDVGAESEHFKRNKYLPDTRSELALPLISHDEVIGALTVQSVERNAFSVDDITVLQTMADQLANAIANARLFENVARSRQEAEAHLRETIALQQLSQSLSRTIHVNEILEVVFQACTKVIGFDYVQISLVDSQDRIKAVAGVGVSETHLNQANQPLASQDIMADIIRTGKTEIITGWDERFNQTLYQAEGHAEWVRLFTPISLRQRNVGIIEAGFNKGKQATIEESQVRLLKAFIDQMVLALDNAQRYEISQRTARREAIIREISGKIRGAVDIDDILKTTVSELGQLLGTSQGGIRLTVAEDDPSISPAATEPVESP
jgi:GAF domain-containing protein